MTIQELDQAKAEEFAGQMLNVLNGAALALMTSIGHQTGLFDTMASLPPATSQQIAEAARLNERYVREWLGAMVVGRIVGYDPATGTYALTPEHAASLTRAAGPDNLAMITQYIPLLGNVEEDVIEGFRNGGGVPYSAYPRFQQLQAEETSRVLDATLIDTTLPLVPGLIEHLQAGINVADVGCGQGHAINLMAQAFPNSRFTGYDFSEEGINAGKAEAERMSLKNAHFEVKNVATLDASGEYDFITAFDVIHDLAQPAKVLKKIFDALRPGGTFLMVDIAASSNVSENIEHPLAPALYTFSVMHCMTVSLEQDGEGLGTVWGEQRARQMLADAGFNRVEVKQVPGDILNNYYLSTKGKEQEMTSKMDSSTPKTAERAWQQVEAQLQAFYHAWQVRNAPDIQKLFSDDDRLLLWGTDRWERIRGRAEADREFGRWIDTCPPWTSFEVTYREMDVRDGIAWVAEEVTGLWSRETESGATHFRITTVWEDKGGEWKVIHAHIDLPLD